MGGDFSEESDEYGEYGDYGDYSGSGSGGSFSVSSCTCTNRDADSTESIKQVYNLTYSGSGINSCAELEAWIQVQAGDWSTASCK